MAIKVLVKRSVPEHKWDALREKIDRLRSYSIDQPGYVSGETLRRIDRPGESLVVSKWKTREAWERWFASPRRRQLQEEVDVLLGEPTEYEIYDYD